MPEETETLLEFPCRFPIKAMGRAGTSFDLLVVEIVRRHVRNLDEGAVALRESRGGKWVSVTVVVEVTSRDQLDAIYVELTAHERVVWVL